MILLFHGRGAISALIRWQTRSKYSHAALMDERGRVIESWQGAGVRTTRLSDCAGVDGFQVQGMTRAMWNTACRWASCHIGDRYDYRSVFRFVTRVDSSPDDLWFCSELVFEAVEHAGIKLLRDVNACAVSPGMLALSPLLIQMKQWT